MRDLQQGKRDGDEWEQHLIHRDGRDVFTTARFTLLLYLPPRNSDSRTGFSYAFISPMKFTMRL